eukprot:Blabericola_migrator_1__6121@NODE_3092_length_2043_cov_117_154352_g1935_i0_p3_GENE_NODE_3092_length_2043_cov_117_154352_g1935_i0NODE_3092_length_2043_cov_117_154352_g1935_i0_p3_ORF_typecomplete_len168_score17_61_NODE_3092_length_2043_cov_117_154352_g1935_i08511354
MKFSLASLAVTCHLAAGQLSGTYPTLQCAGFWVLSGASSLTGHSELAKAFDGLNIVLQVALKGPSNGIQGDAYLNMAFGDSFAASARVYNDCNNDIVLHGPPQMVAKNLHADTDLRRATDQRIYNFLKGLTSWRFSSVGSRPTLTLHSTTSQGDLKLTNIALQFTQL